MNFQLRVLSILLFITTIAWSQNCCDAADIANDNSTEDLVNVSYDIYDTLLQNNVNVEIIEYPPYDSNFNGILDEEDDGHQLFFIVQEPDWSDLINFLNETLN